MKQIVLLLVVVLGIASPVWAANHYVTASGAGSANGSDWSNACADFTGSCAVGSLVRGDTYFVADGAYAGRTFNTSPFNGGAVITIKKASIAAHGTSTGWVDTMGDGQAAFAGKFNIDTGGWTFDGAYRDESNAPTSWSSSAGYGFKVGTTSTTQAFEVFSTVTAMQNNINIYYTHAVGYTPNVCSEPADIGAYTISFNGTCCSHTNSTGSGVHRSLITDGVNHTFPRYTDGFIIEYNWISNGQSCNQNHGEAVNLYFYPTNTVIRWNYFKNIYNVSGNAGTAVISQCCNGAAHEIYGNVFDTYWLGGADGFIGFGVNGANTGDCTNCRVFNNSIIHGHGTACCGGSSPYALLSFPGSGGGNLIQNNLFVDSGNPPGVDSPGATLSHNAFEGAGSYGTSAQTNVPTSIFVDYAGSNYKLASGTTAGTSLSAPYNTDMLGNTRGADGVWDRGAMEFCASGCGSSAVLSGGLRLSGGVRMQ